MGRPQKNVVKLSTWINPTVLSVLRVDAAQMGGSIGDAISRIFEQARARDPTMAAMHERLEAAETAEQAALQVARRATATANKAQDRLAAMSARSKATERRAPWL